MLISTAFRRSVFILTRIQSEPKQKVQPLASLTVKEFALQIVIFDASHQVK
jgi:hypothetical protein